MHAFTLAAMKAWHNTRQSLKKRFDAINNEALKKNLLQALPFWVASGLTGLMAVLYARLFALAEAGVHAMLAWANWIIFISAPGFFFLAWWLVKKFSPLARGSGIPQVMAAIELATPKENRLVDKLVGFRVMVVKVASSLLMVLGGGAVGREGPTIQIAGSVFRFVNNLLPAWWPKISKKNMIMTGAAAGLAAAFNTPLGGIVFAVEELSRTHIRYFRTAIFTSVIIAGLAAQGLLGSYLYLGYPDVSGTSWYIFFPLMLVALICGLGGSAMARIILKLFAFKDRFRFKKQAIYYLLACAFIMAGASFFISHQVLGSGKEIMEDVLFKPEKQVAWYIPIIRFFGPIVSFTAGGAGGVFAPSLTAGASVGALMAGWMQFTGSNANLLILSGMVAFLTGITRSPFTSAILVLEMTDRHSVIFHLMLAGMVASLVSLLIDKKSMYDHLKERYLREVGAAEETIAAAQHTETDTEDADEEMPPVKPLQDNAEKASH